MRASARAAGRKGLPLESDATGGPKESTGVQVFALLTLAATALGCLLALLPAAGHNLRHGAKLYGPELFESKSPLIVWMSLVPSTMADWLHLPSTAVGKMLVCALGGVIGVASCRLLRSWLPHGTLGARG